MKAERAQWGRYCDDDECLAWWPAGPMPPGWTVVVVEDWLHASCPDCTAFWQAEAAASISDQPECLLTQEATDG